MNEDIKKALRFAEYIGERAYEFLGYMNRVGYWQSEDGFIETTESLYESFVNIDEAIKQQDSIELSQRAN